jgi:WD40 repeat protein
MTFSPHGVVASASFSADGTKIVTASWDNSARIWDARTGNDILKLERKHTKAVNRAVFHPTADRVLTASADGTAIVWEIDWENKTAKDIVTLTGHAGGVNDAVFSRDGTRILTASMDKTARIWNAESGVELAQLDDTAAPNPEAPVDPAKPAEPTGHRWAVLRAAFSDDGQYVITGSADDSAKIWFVGGTIQRAGAEVTFDEINMTLTGAGEPAEKNAQIIARMEQAQKLPELDDGQLATLTEAGAATGVIRILKRGRVIRMLYTLSGHTADVTSVAFTPELGTRVLTGSEDYTAKVWDAENGQEILTLKGHSQEVTSVAFSRDGVYALTGSGDGTAIIWLATSEGWQQGGIAPAEPEVRNASLDAGRATGKITSLSQP